MVRVNGKVDQVTQTIKAYVDVIHADLKEGMFLEADLVAKSEIDAIEISRKLLETTNLFIQLKTIVF